MKWKTYERPAAGSTRVRKLFAILPNHTDDGYVVWLGFYWVQEQYLYSLGRGTWAATNVLTTDPRRSGIGSITQ